MMDAVHRFMFEDLDIRGALVRLGPAWHELQARRDYDAPVRDLLGQLTAVTVLIGSNLKLPGRLSFQMQGHGPVRLLLMDCDENLLLRGLAKTSGAVAPLPLPQLLGDGQLVLTLQPAVAAERAYQSIVPLEGDTVAGMFENFLEQSEQTPTRLWLAAGEKYACGLFLQKLPGADERDTDGWNRVQHLASTVSPAELELPPEQLLGRLFPEETLRLFDPRPVRHHCPRDEERVLDMLRTLGRDEVASMLEDQEEIVVHDDVCNHEYRFDADVLERLFSPSARTLH
jgi:molecular chaperone Hsp33